MTTKNAAKILNELVQTSTDSALRFHDGMGRLENEELRRIFQELATERESFAVELRDHVGRLGQNPSDSGTVTETVRRAGRELKSMILRPDDIREVVVCADGEEAAREQFERALGEVSSQLYETIDRQRSEFAKAATLLGELRQTMEQST